MTFTTEALNQLKDNISQVFGIGENLLRKLSEAIPCHISFDHNCEPMVLGNDGERLDCDKNECTGPLSDIRAIKKITTVTAIEVEGSHYMLLNINGRSYRVDLPH